MVLGRYLSSRLEHPCSYKQQKTLTQVPRERKEAERPGLRTRRTMLTNHRPNRDNRSRKHSRQTSKQNHLPNLPREPKQTDRHTDAHQREHQHRFPSKAVSGTSPADHKQHLREGEERFDQPTVEADVALVEIAGVADHLVDEGENGEESDGFDEARVAEEDDLIPGDGLVFVGGGGGVGVRVGGGGVVDKGLFVGLEGGCFAAGCEERCHLAHG